MKNIRTQLFVLFITVLLLMGCGVQKNIDLKSDQGMKIANALPIREDTGLDRSNLDILDEKVYKATGSNLGRVYQGNKEKCINDL